MPASSSVILERTVTEAVRRVLLILQQRDAIPDPSQPGTQDQTLTARVFAARTEQQRTVDDVSAILASRVFGPRLPNAAAIAALTAGTHLTFGGGTYDGSAPKTISTDGVSTATASTLVTRDANAATALNGVTLPAAPHGTGAGVHRLDCYEEGNFTTSITLGTSGTATLAAGFDTLQYTRVGRIVHLQGEIHLSAVSAPIGSVQIAIPFTSSTGTEGGGVAAVSFILFAMAAGFVGSPCGQVPAAAGFLTLNEFAAGSSTDPGAKLQATSVIILSATYETDA